MRLAFGDFIMDTDERRLFAGSGEVRLSPKAFDLLRVLIEHRPKALAKDELFTRLWPDTFVTENNLATLIADLRSALADDAHQPTFIRTVYAYGYAFAATAVEERPPELSAGEAASGWRLIHEHRDIPLQPGENILGRAGPGVIALASPAISRHHARLVVTHQGATIEDLQSKNGTWVGLTPVTGPAALKDGDELRLGSIVLVVRFRSGTSSTETVEQ